MTTKLKYYSKKKLQDAQLPQRDRTAGWVSYGPKWKTGTQELGDNVYGQYRSIFNHCDIIGRQSNRIQ